MEKQMPQLMPLVPELMPMIQLVAKDMVAQNIANVMWACARCEIDAGAPESLFETLAERAFLGADSFNAQDIANIFWASTKLHRRGAPVSPFLDVLPILSEVAVQQADAMKAQAINNVVQAIAELRNDVFIADFGEDLMAVLATETVKKMRQWTDRDLALDIPGIAHALATVQQKKNGLS
mmetsp:Transcript_162261/g.515488  ORF Transcript_162261/g.515488 Transcript_162261/m.515488 type:complete len:180 (-) Transcript_162261:301-840(-)